VRIAVIGLGLIGGSIGLAARERLDAETTGWDLDPSALAAAGARGAIDMQSRSIAQAVDGADAAFVAAPVGALPELVAEVLRRASAACVVTDVGSTKRVIVAAQDDQRFVGGHPLAGAETSGIGHARADLFAGATWYLTPTPTTSGILYERLYRLLSSLGARPVAIDAADHDAILAVVSHLPHVLANVLIDQASTAPGADGERLPATGPSFRDATRVAGANSAIWTDIYLSNRDALIAAIDATVDRLGSVRSALARGDEAEITRWNNDAAATRRRLAAAELASGADLHELRVAVPNRPGVVAQIALELGRAGVNIADLALHPAPSMTEGVVALWLAGADTTTRAERLIVGLGFEVFRA
jgi:prephenate dehydrogenase